MKRPLKIKDCDGFNCAVKLRFGIIDILSLRLKRADNLRFIIIVTNTARWETRRFTSDRTRNKTNTFNLQIAYIPGDPGDPFDITVKVYRFRAGQYETTHFKNYEVKNQTILSNKTQSYQKSPGKETDGTDLTPQNFVDEDLTGREVKLNHKVCALNANKTSSFKTPQQESRIEEIQNVEELQGIDRGKEPEEEGLFSQHHFQRKTAEKEQLMVRVETIRVDQKAEEFRNQERAQSMRMEYAVDRMNHQQKTMPVRRQHRGRENRSMPQKQNSTDSKLTVKSNGPRKIILNLQLDATTLGRISQIQQLSFEVKASNTTCSTTRTMNFVNSVIAPVMELPLSVELQLGHNYKFVVRLRVFSQFQDKYRTVLTREIKHREVLLKSELRELMQKAKNFQSRRRNSQRLPVKFAYRNKSRRYFNNIKNNRSNIMETYIKDNNGDPGCPINGQIKGLFFAVRPEPSTMNIPDESLFGNTRIFLPIEKLIQPDITIYFADFWCHKKIHYLTLVATKRNSQTDKFCKEHLLELNMGNNPFFCKNSSTNYRYNVIEPDFYCCREPRVEILFTEDIDLSQDYIQWQRNVRLIGSGSSTPGGIPKQESCKTCNLYTPSTITRNAF